ncbi:hypothetical protein GCM10009632_52230 [Mycolicibacterium alvei]|uniref:Uncharacterized protein n=1 Tax=Mycolicibacterium alvei TaxID=67081 RepID=A0A6N4V3J2_9MYCO|nr:hypothetical protein MALV_53460 [Mycolicibacterium alvei]
MPYIASVALCLSSAAAIAARDASGCAVQPFSRGRPNCQLPEQVLRYLPSRQIPGPIASGTRGAVIGTSLSGFTGGSGEAQKICRKQEVRQMCERTPHLPVSVEPAGSRMDVQMESIAPQLDSGGLGHPTGRLARCVAEVAA